MGADIVVDGGDVARQAISKRESAAAVGVGADKSAWRGGVDELLMLGHLFQIKEKW